jgi:hypothetical protein
MQAKRVAIAQAKKKHCNLQRQVISLVFCNRKANTLPMTRIVAILTGDLIGSTAAPPEAVERSMRIIANCASEIGPDTDFTRYRGDGWQLRLLRPGDCLWACLLILARLRAEDGALGCRIAIGIGDGVSHRHPQPLHRDGTGLHRFGARRSTR